MSIVVKNTFIGLVNVTGKCVIFTVQNINAARQQLQQLPHPRRKKRADDTVDHKFSREFVQNLRNEIVWRISITS